MYKRQVEQPAEEAGSDEPEVAPEAEQPAEEESSDDAGEEE